MENKKRILVVDDELPILNFLDIKLRVLGYEVITASRGLEALELIDSARPGIVLLDVIMPGMDGFGVLQELRTHSNLPVIVFSARLENKQKALSLGANAFLSKPFDVDDLVSRIQRLLDQKK